MNIVHVILLELIILTESLLLIGYLFFTVMVRLINKTKERMGYMNYNASILIDNVSKIHTTSLGEFRI